MSVPTTDGEASRRGSLQNYSHTKLGLNWASIRLPKDSSRRQFGRFVPCISNNLAQNAALSRQRPRVRVPSSPPTTQNVGFSSITGSVLPLEILVLGPYYGGGSVLNPPSPRKRRYGANAAGKLPGKTVSWLAPGRSWRKRPHLCPRRFGTCDCRRFCGTPRPYFVARKGGQPVAVFPARSGAALSAQARAFTYWRELQSGRELQSDRCSLHRRTGKPRRGFRHELRNAARLYVVR